MNIHGVMVTYRRPQQAYETLSKVATQTRPPDTMTVVDNSPELGGENRSFLDAWGGDIRYLAMSENLGPAGGIAHGMRAVLEWAEPDDWILLIDDDDPPPASDTVERLCALVCSLGDVHDRVGGVGVVGARYDLRRGQVIRIEDHELSAGAVPVDHIGGNQYPLYSVNAVRAVGVFDDRLFFGFDDLEYGLRLTADGWNLYCDGEYRLSRRVAAGRVGKKQSRPTWTMSSDSWRSYYSRRNTLLILRYHRSWRGVLWVAAVGLAKPVASLPRSPRIGLRALRLQYRAVWHGLTGRSGRTVEPS